MKKRLHIFFIVLFTIIFSSSFSTSPLKVELSYLDSFLNTKNIKHSNLSLYAVNLTSNRVVGDYRGEAAVVPASVMKIITAATALEVLGANDTLETKLMYDGTISNGTLNGNLYILGEGDPTLGSTHGRKDKEGFIKEWVLAVKKAGIQNINGNIIVLDDIFGYDGISDKWLWEDMGTSYGQGAYGINVFDNLYTMTLSSGAAGTKPQVLSVSPSISNINFINRAKVINTTRNKGHIRGVPLDSNRVIDGTFMPNQKKIILKSDIPNPGHFLGEHLKKYLVANKIGVTGFVQTGRTTNKRPINPKVLAVTKSLPISEIVHILMRESDNLYTESIYKYLTKIKKINFYTFWKEKGIDTGALVMDDGSGLARTNFVSSKLIVDILKYMDNKHYEGKGADFTELFAIAGKANQGTLTDFLVGAPLVGKIKTGSMKGIQAYAGYITKNGNEYAFAIFVNQWNGTRTALRKEIEKLLTSIN